jgi:hypothetical protein
MFSPGAKFLGAFAQILWIDQGMIWHKRINREAPGIVPMYFGPCLSSGCPADATKAPDDGVSGATLHWNAIG